MSLQKKEKQVRLTVKLPVSIKQSLERAASREHVSLIDYAKQVLESVGTGKVRLRDQMSPEELIAHLNKVSDELWGDKVSPINSVDLINEARMGRTDHI